MDRDKIPLNRKDIQALAETKAPLRTGNDEDSNDNDNENALTPLQQAERDYLAQYLVKRLVLAEEGGQAKALHLVKQTGKGGGGKGGKGAIALAASSHPPTPTTGDPWDSLLTPRPKLIQPPPPITAATRRNSLRDFQKASAELSKMSTEMKRHSHGTC